MKLKQGLQHPVENFFCEAKTLGKSRGTLIVPRHPNQIRILQPCPLPNFPRSDPFVSTNPLWFLLRKNFFPPEKNGMELYPNIKTQTTNNYLVTGLYISN